MHTTAEIGEELVRQLEDLNEAQDRQLERFDALLIVLEEIANNLSTISRSPVTKRLNQ